MEKNCWRKEGGQGQCCAKVIFQNALNCTEEEDTGCLLPMAPSLHAPTTASGNSAANACIHQLMKRKDMNQREVSYLKAEVGLLQPSCNRSDVDEELQRVRSILKRCTASLTKARVKTLGIGR